LSQAGRCFAPASPARSAAASGVAGIVRLNFLISAAAGGQRVCLRCDQVVAGIDQIGSSARSTGSKRVRMRSSNAV